MRVAAYCRASTDSEDHLNSYRSQVKYYTELIQKKPEWSLVDIYADEGITGTQVTKRENFQRLINDCMNNKIDMIITKSISRFARNTVDTLYYVRKLKEKDIAVFFEEEKINTLSIDGELLLTVLSSVAQQEVENISANVKKGLKMKMQRGELIGFNGCLGYDYDIETKSISINQEEAEIVRYIFKRYLEGAGGQIIGKELKNLGYRTKKGYTTWPQSTIVSIIKNVKYKGDILMGKTFTIDPISKRRLINFGEEDKYYIHNHHEGIVSEEVFEKAQEILSRRSNPRRLPSEDNSRKVFYRKYSFSCMIECGFCKSYLTRRKWHSGTTHSKNMWQCVGQTKKGKSTCPESKGIEETQIEKAFMESYAFMCGDNKNVLEEFLKRTEEAIFEFDTKKDIYRLEKEIELIQSKKEKLLDMSLNGKVSNEEYDEKYLDLTNKEESAKLELSNFVNISKNQLEQKKRILEFRKILEANDIPTQFDRVVFESVVEKVIIGGYDEHGNKDPDMISFVYKSGYTDSVDGGKYKSPKKKTGKKSIACYNTQNEELSPSNSCYCTTHRNNCIT